MTFNDVENGTFTKSFNRQLKSIFESNLKDYFFKFSFKLYANNRYPYISKDFLFNELTQTFEHYFPFGVKIVYITPNSNDDHFIEVGVLVKSI